MALWSIDDEGNLRVARRAEDGTIVWDVISSEGEFLAVARPEFDALPYVMPRIRDGKFLTVATDELDIQYAVVAVIER